MLIKEKRSSRNSKASDDIYHKFFTENECVYIKQFGHLIKNEWFAYLTLGFAKALIWNIYKYLYSYNNFFKSLKNRIK